jgi:phosphatidylglycerophosphatase C
VLQDRCFTVALNLALFDFDGTITHAQTLPGFLRFAARRERILAGWILLGPLILAYKLGLVPVRAMRVVLVRFAFQGEKAGAIRNLGLRYMTEVLPGHVRSEALERIEWHKRRGDVVVVVTANYDLYLSHWCKSIGVDLICTELEERAGTLTGRYVRGDCSGIEKVRRIRERYDLDRYAHIYAYGDSEEDRDMLGLAHEQYYRWEKIAGGQAEVV